MTSDPQQMLTHFDRAKQEVRTATTLAAAKAFADKARAVKAYAKLAKDRTLVERATELRLNAERRMGELLTAMEATGEKARQSPGRKRTKGNRSARSTDNLPTVADLGISKNEAARAKRLAEPPQEVFDAAVASAKKAGELTDAVVVKHATRQAAKAKAVRGAWPFRGTWSPAEIAEAEAWFAIMPKGEALKTRLAEGGCTTRGVLRAARHCAGASVAYRQEAVAMALRTNGAGSVGAAMLYGDEPPGDKVALWIAGALTEFDHDFRSYGTDQRIINIRAVLEQEDAASDALKTKEEHRWKRLYAAKSPT